MSERVRYEVGDGVARVTLDAPERLNAVDPGMLEAVVAHVEASATTSFHSHHAALCECQYFAGDRLHGPG